MIDEEKCKLCGICAKVCPFDAITMQHYTDEQIIAQMDGMLEAAAAA